VIGNRFIETELMLPVRRWERFGVRRALAERLTSSNAQIVSMPPAVPIPESNDGTWGPGPFIEGGDVFVISKNIYVGNSGNGSNTAGVKWLTQYLGDEYPVHEIKLTKVMLHLDCCLATPRPGLAVICREGFVDGVPEFLKDWTLVDVPLKDAKEKMACNGLVLKSKLRIYRLCLSPMIGSSHKSYPSGGRSSLNSLLNGTCTGLVINRAAVPTRPPAAIPKLKLLNFPFTSIGVAKL